ncbi:MAG: LysM peptidoglycan-binding domain-containing protein [Anaerolineae bacterium]|nr:LysM peptidoglycan-binding domain-containing protein [Anaerolineae bacterium]MDQ7035101.1 LysM peptidoglycan-binding domain-containing protein [Anaerolineae bacterium]
MKLKSLFRLTAILLVTSLWFGIGFGVQAQTSCDSETGNLLTNCGFEDGFRTVAGSNPRSVATGWEPWNAARTADMPTFQNTQPTYFASSNAASQGAVPRNREGGADSQVYFSFFETHDAGVYQQVTGIDVGAELRFSIYGYVFSSTLDDLNISENPGGVAFRVGIDPKGGTDPLASSVRYSEPAIFYDSFRQYSIITTAESDTVTVFVRTTVSEPVQFSYVYLDDAVLEVTPESQPPAETEEPTDEPTAIPTDVPTKVPTDEPTDELTADTPSQVTDEPTEEPTPTIEGTEEPTDVPTTEPTVEPTDEPTPTIEPTQAPVLPTATEIGADSTPDNVVTSEPGGEDVPISEAFPGRIIHTVQRGDTVGELATRYGSSLNAIQQANGLDDSFLIFRGQGLIIPIRIVPATETPSPTPIVVVVTATSATTTDTGTTNGSGGAGVTPNANTYIVQPGDYLSSIARRFNTTVGTLIQLNGIANPNRILVGQELRLPGTGGATTDAVPTSPPVQPTTVPAQPTEVQQQPTAPSIIPTQATGTGGSTIPAPATYVVQPGDNLYRIAIRFNVSLADLGTANNITNFNLIFVGQVLQIP